MQELDTRKLTVLKASAGSGKTFNLALSYIALAISDDGDFRQILAVTFTNKATREMKERILNFLTELAYSQNSGLITLIQEKTGLDKEQIKNRSELTLKKILHHYSHFSVSTIDSFNQRILRAFTREIGLIGNFNLELDIQKVVDMGIDIVLDSARDDKRIKNWILDFIREKLLQGKSWDIKKDMRSLALELYNETYKLLELNAKGDLVNPDLDNYIKELKKIKHSFENQMKEFGKKAVELAEKHQLGLGDFKYGKTGAFNYFVKIQQSGADYTPTARVFSCLENQENWYTKTAKNKETIIAALESGIHTFLQSAVHCFEQNSKEYFTADAILKNLYTLGLFSEIKKAIDKYKLENDIFLLNDTNAFLKAIISANETPFIYEKTGSWYYHYLIDEFQDTSRLQWENFKPLVANSLAENNENLIVGDSKQSIYRWRGGDWELIEKDLDATFGETYLNKKVLETNWRSHKNIVEFNNALFSAMPGQFKSQFQKSYTGDIGTFASDFDLIYQHSDQDISSENSTTKGYVRIDFVKKEGPTKEWREESLQWLKGQIEKLQDKGYPLGSIAILTRRKSEGAEVVDFLNEQKNTHSKYRYDVLSNEALLIKNFAAIRLIINSLHFINNPKDDLALANVAVEYFNELHPDQKLDELLSRVTFKEEINSLFPETFIDNLEHFRQHNLTDAINELIEIFQLNKQNRNTAYLMAFQDIVLRYAYENTNEVSAFLEWWEEEKGRQTLQSPEKIDAIRVMTIHKSKGLEFDVVLIPFLNWSIDHEGNKDIFMWCLNEKAPFNQQKLVPLKYSGGLKNSYFDEVYFDEKHKAYIDNLNLAYVAFTRAKKCLMIYGESKGRNAGKISDILYETINQQDFDLTSCFDETSEIFEYGSLEEIKKVEAIDIITQEDYLQSQWSQKANLKRRGKELFRKEAKNRKEKINYGILVHEILAEISDPKDADIYIDRYRVQGIINIDEKHLIRDQLEKIFANPEVAKWFHSEWHIKTERSILSSNQEELRPDRVMINGLRAIVIDFKTGEERPSHSKQLIRYRNKLIEMGFQTVDAYLLYISTNKVKQIA